MIPEEEIKKVYAYMASLEEEKQKEWEKVKEQLKPLINPKYFDFAEDNETYQSEGIVEITLTDEKRNGYPDYQCCRVKGEDLNLLYMRHNSFLDTLECNSNYEGEEIEYWVWQTTGYLGDDYSGFLLLPLLDGKKYWKVNYSC